MSEAAEVRDGREREHVGDVLQRQGRVTEQAGDLQRRVTVDPMDSRLTAIQFDGLRQVFGGYAKGIGIIGYLAVLAVVTVVEHGEERLHEACHFFGQFGLAVEVGMEIEEVDDHALDCIEEQVAIEMVMLLLQAHTDIFKVLAASFGLGVVERHDRVMEEHQSAAQTIIRERCCKLGKLRYHIDHYRLKIIGLGDEFGAFCLHEDEAIVRAEREVVFVEAHNGRTGCAEAVDDVTFQSVHL